MNYRKNKTVAIHKAGDGYAYLNAGCGGHFSPEWNNVDLYRNQNVVYHDLRNPLPYSDGVFDVVYSSHVLEHLDPDAGQRLMREMYRVCGMGGICRMVVPDFERACQQYLHWLAVALSEPSRKVIQRYQWSVLELIDQYVREKSGGKMLEALQARDFDEDYVRERNGDEFWSFYSDSRKAMETEESTGLRERIKKSPVGTFIRSAMRVVRTVRNMARSRPPGPRESGQVHRWLYDRLSLRLLMEDVGFSRVQVQNFDTSYTPGWERYRLDLAKSGDKPRKPDSLYMEGVKPIQRGASNPIANEVAT